MARASSKLMQVALHPKVDSDAGEIRRREAFRGRRRGRRAGDRANPVLKAQLNWPSVEGWNGRLKTENRRPLTAEREAFCALHPA